MIDRVTDGGSSLPAVQRLLAALVASKPSGRIAEIGTAFGEGARAMVDALGADATLVTVEPDETRHAHARELLAGQPVELVRGRWEEVLAQRVRDADPSDHDWIAKLLLERWGSTRAVSRGHVHEADALPAKVALVDGAVAGLATFDLAGGACELVSLDALTPNRRIGSELLNAVAREARARGASRLWLITSNDNLDAVRFYQRRGLRLVAVHSGAVDQARQLKPSIPPIGDFGIPIHDELELELELDSQVA